MTGTGGPEHGSLNSTPAMGATPAMRSGMRQASSVDICAPLDMRRRVVRGRRRDGGRRGQGMRVGPQHSTIVIWPSRAVSTSPIPSTSTFLAGATSHWGPVGSVGVTMASTP